MSTQPKDIAVLHRHRSAKLYQQRGIVPPRRLSDEANLQLARRRTA